ncbi:MAG: sulfite exporter TauE/SafE family protein [Terriglobia bacterium]
MTVALLGFITGILIGLTGTGGGSVLTPLLLVFTPFPALVVIGTDLVASAATKLVGFVEHWRLGRIYWGLAGYIILGSLPGSVVGILVIRVLKAHLSPEVLEYSLKVLVGLVLFAASFSLPYVRRQKKRKISREITFHARMTHRGFLAVGAAVGFLVAVTSVGSGSLLMVFMLLVAPMPIAELVGTDVMLGLATTVLAGILHVWMGHFNTSLFLGLLMGSLPGVVLGSWFSHRIPERYFGWLLSVLYFSLGARLLLSF